MLVGVSRERDKIPYFCVCVYYRVEQDRDGHNESTGRGQQLVACVWAVRIRPRAGLARVFLQHQSHIRTRRHAPVETELLCPFCCRPCWKRARAAGARLPAQEPTALHQPRLQPSAHSAQIRHGSNTTMAKNNRGRTISVRGYIQGRQREWGRYPKNRECNLYAVIDVDVGLMFTAFREV